MEVQLFPHSSRPGVGMRPRQENRRPMLPQHSRHCPVLEAGNGIGFLVYPPLEETEAFYAEFLGEGSYRFTFYMGSGATRWQPVFAVTITMPIGSLGRFREDVEFLVPDPPISRQAATEMVRVFIVPEDLGTPAGAITLRGGSNFRTPEGWDTVYSAVFNNIERPVAPMLVVRVETDWYAHDSEFRYVLQPGEGIPGAHNLPIGQVFFMPREQITLRDSTTEEVAEIALSRKSFARQKSEMTIATPHGLQYSPYYARQARVRKTEER